MGRAFRAVAPILVGPLVILGLFAPVLSTRRSFAFRDVSQFYTPLYDSIGDRLRDDPTAPFRTALWNPLDQAGMPLVGETTTAIYYPLRWLVYAPDWSAHTLMGLYNLSHLLIGSLTAFACARRVGCSKEGCIVASCIYPLSGGVLFLTTNPPYLVSAAWLPLGLGWLLFRNQTPGASRPGRRSTDCLIPGIAAAMMVLGGEPATALHLFLIVSMVEFFRLAKSVWKRNGFDVRKLLSSWCQLSFVGCVALVLSAPQWAASLDWALQSDRSQSVVPDEAYAFSIPIWRLSEYLAPNLFGAPWPTYTRWDRAVFAGGVSSPANALWTPSLYSGVFAAFAMLTAMIRTGKSTGVAQRHRRIWLIVFGLATLASLGKLGGIYWLLYEYLPGYSAFRYPSKWLPISALAMSMVAGLHDRNTNSPARVSIVSVAVIIVLGVVGFLSIPSAEVGDSIWATMQSQRAGVELAISLVLALAFWFLWSRNWRLSRCVFVAVIVFDLAIAHHDFAPTIDRSERVAVIANCEVSGALTEPPMRWMRGKQDAGIPLAWQTHASESRMVEVEVSDQLNFRGRWHHAEGKAVFNSIVSIGSREVSGFWKNARLVASELNPQQQMQCWKLWARWLGLSGMLKSQSAGTAFEISSRRYVVGEPFVEQFPRARESHGWTVHADVVVRRGTQDESWQRMLRRVVTDDRAHVAEVDADDVTKKLSFTVFREINENDASKIVQSIRQTVNSPEVQEFTISTEQPVFLSRRVYQDGHWRASLRSPATSNEHTRDLKVWRTDLIAQGVEIPAGEHVLRMEYLPWWHPLSIWFAVMGGIATASVLAIGTVRRVLARDELRRIQK